MRSIIWAEWLWGKKARLSYLLCAAALLLFAMLGGRELWTQEHRWSDIVAAMIYSHDYLHPILDNNEYYDKPLLSYWFILSIRLLTGQLSLWVIRLPSAIAGFIAVWAMYRLGCQLKDKQFGLLAGWLLLTTFYFAFWARVGNADMMNLAGALFAVAWYFEKRWTATLMDYVIFFLILAITALCKGLVGPVVALVAILPDIVLQKSYKKYMHWRVFVAMLPALLIYFLPFAASLYFNDINYQQNGLYQVYRENILRYVQPFDHKDPVYTYFIFLPLYLVPWVVFFFPALFSIRSRWQTMRIESKWMVLATGLLFLFFTLSGSRRNYYVLPIVPFAILLIADWLLTDFVRYDRLAARLTVGFFVALFLTFSCFQPLFYAYGGLNTFKTVLKTEADKIKPWQEWQFVMLDPDAKIRFYLQLPPELKHYDTIGRPDIQTMQSLAETWTMLQHPSPDSIYLSRKRYAPYLQVMLPNYSLVVAEPTFIETLFHVIDPNSPVAFVPR